MGLSLARPAAAADVPFIGSLSIQVPGILDTVMTNREPIIELPDLLTYPALLSTGTPVDLSADQFRTTTFFAVTDSSFFQAQGYQLINIGGPDFEAGLGPGGGFGGDQYLIYEFFFIPKVTYGWLFLHQSGSTTLIPASVNVDPRVMGGGPDPGASIPFQVSTRSFQKIPFRILTTQPPYITTTTLTATQTPYGQPIPDGYIRPFLEGDGWTTGRITVTGYSLVQRTSNGSGVWTNAITQPRTVVATGSDWVTPERRLRHMSLVSPVVFVREVGCAQGVDPCFAPGGVLNERIPGVARLTFLMPEPAPAALHTAATLALLVVGFRRRRAR